MICSLRVMRAGFLPLAILCVQSVIASARAETKSEAKGEPKAEPKAETARARQGADCQLCYEGASGLELAVPLWLPIVGIKGQGTQSDGTAQHIKLDSHLEFAIVAEVKLRLGPMGLGLSANGLSLGSQVVRSQTGETLGNVELGAYFGRATLNWYTPPYRFAEGARTELLSIWPYMGARYALLSGSGSSPDGKLLLEGNTTWGEPLFGVEVLIDLRRGWLFEISGDLGGFSVGTEISAWTAVRAQYAVTDWLNFNVGWTLYYARFPLHEGTASLLLQGPGAGLGIPLF